jgi:FkbM family methyltransferase
MALVGSGLRTAVRSVLVRSPLAFRAAHFIKGKLQEILHRPHDEDFRALGLFPFPGDPLFVDIGANSGQAARSILAVVPNARVVSFEPNPMHWGALRGLRDKNSQFDFFGFALGEAESSMWLYWPVYNGCEFSPLASLDEGTAAGWLNEETVLGFRSEKLSIRKALVEVKTLDSFGLLPSAIKVDVEGGSYQVLRGARETLLRCQPVLLVEEVKSGDPVSALLAGFNYLPCSWDSVERRLDLGCYGVANTYFIHESRLRDFLGVSRMSEHGNG